MKIISGGVCAAKGFKASGVHCGIRKNRTKRDLALIYSEKVASAAAVYTLTSSRARRWSSRKIISQTARRRRSYATVETRTPATRTALR